MNKFAITFLLALSQFLHVQSIPSDPNQVWKIEQKWTQDAEGRFVFQAESSSVVDFCRNSPSSFVQFPIVILGAHELSLDNQSIEVFGDPSFREMRSLYGSPSLRCQQLAGGKVLHWTAYSKSQYFARFASFPKMVSSRPLANLFSESLNLMAVGSLWVMALFTFVIFFGKVPLPLTLAVVSSNLALSVYFMGAVGGLMGLRGSPLLILKMTDLGLWVGLTMFSVALYHQGILTKRLLHAFLVNFVIGLALILSADSLDSVQLGTSVPFVPGLLLDSYFVIKTILHFVRARFERRAFFACLSIFLLGSVCFNDVFVVTGVMDGYMILPLGFMAGLLFLAISVNDSIAETYRERDYLRSNLEHEVEKKTEELRTKTRDLEQTNVQLKETQAELIQSAKLASLGTLSAGIAHEINNSLNYVYGSLRPIEKMVSELPDDARRAKLLSLTKIMQEGMKLTFEIIKSLKNFTGLNQAKVNEFSVKEVVDSVLTILRSKIKDRFEVTVNIDASVRLYGSLVGLNQVLVNLVGNSIDAMTEGGKLTIEAETLGTDVIISIADTGSGIPENIRSRLFDPFFTTKEVGSGTGLGLYIVKKEIDRHHGTIEVQSEVGKGTKFILRLPLKGMETMAVAA